MKNNTRSPAPVTNRATMFHGGSTAPTVELHRRANGRCRLFWHACDQDGMTSGTMATFISNSWDKALAKGRAVLAASFGDATTA